MYTDLKLAREIQSVMFDTLLVKVDSPHTDLLEAGLLDSLRLIDLLAQLEERFGVRFDYQSLEYDDFRSAASIALLVAKQKGFRNGTAAAAKGFAA